MAQSSHNASNQTGDAVRDHDQSHREALAASAECSRTEAFLSLHAQNQHRLSAFVHALVPNWQDAEEIVQDTLVVLWRKFDEFDRSTSFFAWAARVAQYEVLNYRRKTPRRCLVLENDVVEAIATAAVEQMDDVDLRREALEQCIKKLPERDREIIQLRYGEGLGIESAAAAVERTAGHVQRLLRKIRHNLLRCIQLKLSEIGA